MKRRGLLQALAAAPALAVVPAVQARDYTSADEVLIEIDRLASVAGARLDAIAAVRPVAAAFVASAQADLARHRRAREAQYGRMPARTAVSAEDVDEATSLEGLRATLEELMYAHAEGLPALRDSLAVQILTEHMIDVARLRTVVDLWVEAEDGDV